MFITEISNKMVSCSTGESNSPESQNVTLNLTISLLGLCLLWRRRKNASTDRGHHDHDAAPTTHGWASSVLLMAALEKFRKNGLVCSVFCSHYAEDIFCLSSLCNNWINNIKYDFSLRVKVVPYSLAQIRILPDNITLKCRPCITSHPLEICPQLSRVFFSV